MINETNKLTIDADKAVNLIRVNLNEFKLISFENSDEKFSPSFLKCTGDKRALGFNISVNITNIPSIGISNKTSKSIVCKLFNIEYFPFDPVTN